MKTSEQIKGAIRNISKSKYRKNFILKGGLLISSVL